MWTGAPCTAGNREVIWIARMACWGFNGRIETTIGPEKRPAGVQAILVRYMGTRNDCSTCRKGMPSSTSACSNEYEQPMTKQTRSSRHHLPTSAVSSTSSPSFHTR